MVKLKHFDYTRAFQLMEQINMRLSMDRPRAKFE